MVTDLAAELRAAAFGAHPELSDRTIAHAERGPARLRWLAAVVLGARGRYARAATVLHELARCADPLVSSLGASTFASHRRQLGGHADARRWDAIGLRRCVAPSERAAEGADPDGVDIAGALGDALLGLAADALALGRQQEARRVLARFAAGTVAGVGLSESWRTRVRHDWVCAEVELAAGNPRAACPPAETAAALAREQGAIRHLVKSDIVLAAALAGAGEADDRSRAADLAGAAAERARRYRLASLVWPAELIAADLDPARSQEHRSSARDALHGVLRHSDPAGRTLALLSPWIPVRHCDL